MANNELLPKFRIATGLTIDDIADSDASDLLDANGSVESAASAFFDRLAIEQRALIDISESGSSRAFSNMLSNTLRLAELWRRRIPAVATSAVDVNRAGRTVEAIRV